MWRVALYAAMWFLRVPRTLVCETFLLSVRKFENALRGCHARFAPVPVSDSAFEAETVDWPGAIRASGRMLTFPLNCSIV